MVARPTERVASHSPSANHTREIDTGPRCSPSTLYQVQIAMLRWHVTALEAKVERQKKQRQAIVDRYERLLDQQ